MCALAFLFALGRRRTSEPLSGLGKWGGVRAVFLPLASPYPQGAEFPATTPLFHP